MIPTCPSAHKEADRPATFIVYDHRGIAYHSCDFHLKAMIRMVWSWDANPGPIQVKPL